MGNDPEHKPPSAGSPYEPSADKPPGSGEKTAPKSDVTPIPSAVYPPEAAAASRLAAPVREGPVPLDNDTVKRYREKFGPAILQAWMDRKQAILVVAREQLAEICRHSRDEEKFDLLSNLTALDWPRREKRFDVVLELYSFEKNERLRLKASAAADERVPSVQGIWTAANWMEREVYDMFGIVFEGHPDLKRILLPEEWQGHPLRKDYGILAQDMAWVRENLGIESGQ